MSSKKWRSSWCDSERSMEANDLGKRMSSKQLGGRNISAKKTNKLVRRKLVATRAPLGAKPRLGYPREQAHLSQPGRLIVPFLGF